MNDTGHYPLARWRMVNLEEWRFTMTALNVVPQTREELVALDIDQLYDVSSVCDMEPAVDSFDECVACWAYLEAQHREDSLGNKS